MKARIDHLVLAARSLDDAKTQWHAATGLDAIDGGSHPGGGTCNALCGLADGAYVELLAQDPAQPENRQPTLPETLRPFHWAVAVADLVPLAALLDDRGVAHTGAIDMSRRTPTGDTLNWQLLFVLGDSGRGAIPFFIDWLGSQHPSQTLGADVRLLELRSSAPADSILHWLLPELDLPGVRIGGGVDARLEFRFAISEATALSRNPAWQSDCPAGFPLG